MPPPSSRMTKNQTRDIRYRPGKATADEVPDFESESEDDEIGKPRDPPPKPVAKAAQTTLRRRKLPPVRRAPAPKQPSIDLEGFVTASESSSDEAEAQAEAQSEESEEESEEDASSSEEEDSSSEEEQKPRLLAPKFISKAQRSKLQSAQQRSEDQAYADEERRRQEKADELLQAQIEKDKALRAAGKKAWDDDDAIVQDEVDDTDGLDPEAEQAAWKLRELKRVRRDRLALVAKEQEREEVERRRNLTAEEREAEDREHLDQQKAEQEGRGKMAYMQKYFHKGAFFHGDDQDEDVKAALSRDLAGARFVDDTNKDTLPEYMRIRDMALLGRKSRTKYKDLKSEDTGRFGDFGDRKQKFNDVDERFRPEYDDYRGEQRTGANSAPVGTRRQREDDGDQRRNEKRSKYE